jgi:hypothetical protein
MNKLVDEAMMEQKKNDLLHKALKECQILNS